MKQQPLPFLDASLGKRACSFCKEEKTYAEFEGKRRKCKKCRSDEFKARAQTEEFKINNRRWKKQQYAKRKLNPDAMLEFQIRQCGYNITVGQYRAMEESQAGLCALCGGTNRDGKRLFIDHDHRTGYVRGLLCKNCNAAIGMLCDRVPEWITRVTDYLKKAANAR